MAIIILSQIVVGNRPSYKITILGDVMLARRLGDSVRKGVDPFQFIKPHMSDSDLVVANLETNISREGTGKPKEKKLFTFKSPPESIKFLKEAGIEVVSLANNHTMDYGPEALVEEMDLLRRAGMLFFGAGKNIKEAFQPAFYTLGSQQIKLGFLGFTNIETWFSKADENTPGHAYFNFELIEKAIRGSAKKCDLLIVMPHWGKEYIKEPTEKQIERGRKFIDWGADLVVGNHVHVYQGFEEYKGKMIYYALGNCVFDASRKDPVVRKGKILDVVVESPGNPKDQPQIKSTKLTSIEIDTNGMPHIRD